jgi:hypothetical protein
MNETHLLLDVEVAHGPIQLGLGVLEVRLQQLIID